MSKRFTDTEIWQKEWFLKLSLKQKMLLRFLFDNCDCAGVYEPNFMLLSFCIGETITENDFKNLKQVRRLENGNYLIEDFLKFQYGINDYNSLNPKFSVHKGIIKSLEKNKLLPNPYVRVTQPLQDMDKDMDKDNIDTIQTIKEKEKKENVVQIKKADPYTEIKAKLKEVGQKVYGDVFISREDCENALERSLDNKDFWETLEPNLEKLKTLDLDFKGYKPKLSWLLKEKNYADFINGVYNKAAPDLNGKSLIELQNMGLSEEQILNYYRSKELG